MTSEKLIKALNETDNKQLKDLLLKLVASPDPNAKREGYFVLTTDSTKQRFVSHSISGGIFTYTKSSGRTFKIPWGNVALVSLEP